MDALDEIPWKDLTHAYGSAADVPDLLRSLRTAAPDLRGEDSPLWHLFGNIWHQGTVYEATAYAVPFLTELVVDPQIPDRVGILSLLAEIAKGSSYRDVHGNLRCEPDFEVTKSRELLWVQQAHDAVAAGFTRFMDLTHEAGDVRFAAANVLAQLPEYRTEVAAVLQRLLQDEKRIPYRAGLMLMFGVAGDLSQETLCALTVAVNGAEMDERHAAAFSIVRLNVSPAPEGAHEAIMEAITDEDLETNLDGLPWDAPHRLDPEQLFAYLNPSQRDKVIDGLIASLESGTTDTVRCVTTLIHLLFPLTPNGPTPKVTASGMTPRQYRAVRAFYKAMKGGQRIFYSHFPAYGLPDTKREWRELASGRDVSPVDESLPMLADVRHPHQAVAPGKLKVGQRVIHRHFGVGTVTQLDVRGSHTFMTIHFTEEGVMQLSFPTDGSP